MSCETIFEHRQYIDQLQKPMKVTTVTIHNYVFGGYYKSIIMNECTQCRDHSSVSCSRAILSCALAALWTQGIITRPSNVYSMHEK